MSLDFPETDSKVTIEDKDLSDSTHIQTEEFNNTIPLDLSPEARRWADAIIQLREPCDRNTYGERKRAIAAELGVSLRTLERRVKEWEALGLAAFATTDRKDKGKSRVSRYWQDFVVKKYKEGLRGSKRRTRRQVALQVQAHDDELLEQELAQTREGFSRLSRSERNKIKHEIQTSGQIKRCQYRQKYGSPPDERTVYRLLEPLIQQRERKQSVRNVGWHGEDLAHKTREGKVLSVPHSNEVWQIDHTEIDLLVVDEYGDVLDRLWLTKVTDSYSRCIMGFRLGFDAPSSQVTALALRHAILPKQYGEEYKLQAEWAAYGIPENIFTDGGKDFRSNHFKDIALHLDFSLHLRDRPSEGGIEERGFGTMNTDFLSGFYGYLGSNIAQRPKSAEKDACFTIRELHQLLVRYIVDNYNQRLDARTGEQRRIERWEAGLIRTPRILEERELDICLMRKTRRSVYRGGYLKFENLLYRGEYLGSYEGQFITLRFDPDDITTVWVYYQEPGKSQEKFLSRAHAQGLEAERLSLEEAKAASRHIRKIGQSISNHSILAEVRDREVAIEVTKSKKARKKQEQEKLYTRPEKQTEQIEDESQPETLETGIAKRPKVWNYDDLLE